MSSSFDKFAILDSFLDEVGSYLPEIEGNLDRLEQAPDDSEALEEAYRRAHTIGGSASMMDFPALSQVAHAMEDVLSDALDEVVRLDGEAIALLRRSLGRARLLLEAIKTGTADDGRVIAEDAADHAAYRQHAEARRTGNEMVQDAIIVTPDAPPAVSGVGRAARSRGEAEEWPGLGEQPVPPLSGGAEAAAALDATPGIAGLPDWLSLLGNAEQPAFAAEAETAFSDRSHAAGARQAEEFGEHITRPLPIVTPAEPAQAAEPMSAVAAERPEMAPTLEERGAGAVDGMEGDVTWPALTPASGDEPTLVTRSGEQQPSLAEMLAAFQSPESGEWPEQPLADVPVAAAVPPFPTAAPARADYSWESPGIPERSVPVNALSSGLDQGLAAFAPLTNGPATQQGGDAIPSLAAWQELVEHEEQVRQGAASLKETLAALRVLVTTIEQERTELRGFLDGSKDAIDRLEDWAGKAMGLNLRQSPDHVRRYLPLSVLWVVTTRLKKILSLLKDAATGLAATDGELSAASLQLANSIQACGPLISSVLAMATPSQEGGFSATVAHFSWTPPLAGQPAVPSARPDERPRVQTVAEIEPRLRAEIAEQVRREETSRLRQELEIEVRQQVLSSIQMNALGQGLTLSPPVYQELVVKAPQSPTAPLPKKVVRAAEQSEETLEVFRAEAEEHLQTIDAGIKALEKLPEDREMLQSVRRAIHTLKGAAAMMGFAPIADLSHIFEDLLDRIMEGDIALDSGVLGLILDTSETLEQLVTGRTREHGGEAAVVQVLRPRYQSLLGQVSEEGAGVGLEDAAVADDLAGLKASAAEGAAQPPGEEGQAGSHLVALGTAGEAAEKGEMSVRVRLKKLDELVNLFGEMLVNRSILEERLGRLLRMVADVNLSSTRLNDVGKQLETRFEAALLPSGRIVQASGASSGVLSVGTGPLERGAAAQGRAFPVPSGPIGGSPSKIADHLADFDELELDRYSEFHRLSRGLSEGVSDMTTLSGEMEAIIRECESIFGRENRLSSTFQDQLLKMRLVPISTLVPRLYRTARAIALRLGKEIELEVEGEETEVDRSIYEEMVGALLHVVRNAVTHGIEAPDAREAAGKPRVGQIKLSASYEGNQIVITMRDDGTGIDAERVRSTAITRGLLDARAPLSEQAVLNLIFRPGFSTAEVISEESGRGVGLDVVADVARRLRGSVEVESTPGSGSAFTMKFPISVQIQRAVLVRASNQTYAIPMALVEQIGRLDYCERTAMLGVPAIMMRGEPYELVQLGSLLELPVDKVDERASVLLVVAGRRRYALVADAVLGKQEIVAKDLGHHLREVRGIAGATVLGNGQVVLILEVLELLARRPLNTRPTVAAFAGLAAPAAISTVPTRSLAPTWSSALPVVGRELPQAPHAAGRAEEPYVLVVDDSPSVRRVVSNMLKTAGWEVQTARDGLETLEIAARRKPAAVLLDIEMPRMDGYELIATLRSQDQYKHLPVIVLTSRAANKHHQRAMQLGADAYLVKPYQDEELLRTLNTLVRGARASN